MNFLKRMKGAVVLAMICMAFAVPLQAQVYSTTFASFSGVPAAVTNNTTTTLSASDGIINVRQNQGLAILPTFAATAATLSNAVFRLTVSADGTNWTTTTPLEYHIAMNGTNIITGYKLFPPTELNNVRYVKMHSVQNNAATGGGGAGLLITRITYSYSN